MATGPPLPDVPAWLPVWHLAMLGAVLVSLAVVWTLVRPRGRWGERLRSRFVLGVPWGTLLTIAGVAAVYLFLQGGWHDPRNPLVVPFRSWSYFYPLGVLTAAFSHAGLGHVTGNLVGTAVFGTVLEYAWGHFPTERGSQSFRGPRENPYVRILAVPAGAFLVGMLTSLFSVGPVVGFSGVVFAMAGFALVHYPVVTVVGLLVDRVLGLVVAALRAPTLVAEARPRFVTPWWADIAIQGHALGLFVGVLLGGALLVRRGRRPAPGRVWAGALLFAVAQSLWALYWFRGNGRYVLFQGAGTAAVFLLAALVAAALTASDRTLLDSIDLRRREAAVGVLLSLTLALGIAAVPTNLVTAGDPGFEDGIEVRDYTVTYDENVRNRMVSVVNVSVLGETTDLNTSGVIVTNRRRGIFRTAVPASELRFKGEASVLVGGVGWRERVHVRRTGWTTAGNDSVYLVALRRGDGNYRPVFESDPVTAEPRIDNRTVSIRPAKPSFRLRVRLRNRTLGTTRMPEAGTNVSAGGISFNRTDDRIYALRGGTRVRIASEQAGRRQR